MSEIHESINVDVPFEQVSALARRFVESLPHKGEDEATITLQTTIASLQLQRDATINVRQARRRPGCEVLEVSWRSSAGGPYPVFLGTLGAEQEDCLSCRLDLDGGYVPPGSVVGLAFDEVVGRHIARGVAQDLLRTLKLAFERFRTADQAAWKSVGQH